MQSCKSVADVKGECDVTHRLRNGLVSYNSIRNSNILGVVTSYASSCIVFDETYKQTKNESVGDCCIEKMSTAYTLAIELLLQRQRPRHKH